ncbi:MAG: sodium:alanine symporter family protein [Ferrimonas sp.]
MDTLASIVNHINGIVWGVPMLVLILGVGLYLTAGLKFLPLRKLSIGFKLLWQGRGNQGKGDISAFNALMTALSATIGTGNIAGVATAIALGGPGALFWMWCTALVGMATKYSEAVLAVNFREVKTNGEYAGGPMYYIKNGLGKKWAWLATLFALFGSIAGFGIGNGTQSNSVAQALESTFSVPPLYTGLALMVLVGAVLLGGIRRIAAVAGKIVPLMALFYFIAGVTILAFNFNEIIPAFKLVITHAFTGTAAQGGFAGAAVWAAIRFGVARGVFSNEAGLGSAPIAHAAARTENPVRQGLIAMLGTFIDTIIVCSITGLAIIVTGVWSSGDSGAVLTSNAFAMVLPYGQEIVAIALAIFAFTTILGWSFYCERCVQYLFGDKAIIPFRVIFTLAVPVGAVLSLNLVWLIADTLNAMMAIPNLIALLLLSPVVFKLTKQYFNK